MSECVRERERERERENVRMSCIITYFSTGYTCRVPFAEHGVLCFRFL